MSLTVGSRTRIKNVVSQLANFSAPPSGVDDSAANFVAIFSLLEIIHTLSPRKSEELAKFIDQELPWAAPYTSLADSILNSEAGKSTCPPLHHLSNNQPTLADNDHYWIKIRQTGTELITFEAFGSWFITLLPTDLKRRVLIHGEHELPPNCTIELRSKETIELVSADSFDSEFIDRSTLSLWQQSLLQSEQGKRYNVVDNNNNLLISTSPFELEEGDYAELSFQNGFEINPGKYRKPININGRLIKSPTPVLPLDKLQIGEFHASASKLVHQISQTAKSTPWELDIDNVSLAWKSGKPALNQIDLTLHSGNLVAIMGPSGCGKSTLLSSIMGDLPLSNGSISLNHPHGRILSKAFVPQDDILLESLTVEENLRYAGKLRSPQLSSTDLENRITATLKEVGLESERGLKVGGIGQKTLSGGQRKRLNIGLELMGDSDLLILDEPTSGLSSNDALKIANLLKRLAEQEKLVLVVIHQPAKVLFDHFDKIIVLDVGGSLSFYGNIEDVYDYFTSVGIGTEKLKPQTASPDDILATMEIGDNSTSENDFVRLFSPEFWKEYYEATRNIYHPPGIRYPTPPPLRKNISSKDKTRKLRKQLQRIGALSKREWHRKLSTPRTLLVNSLLAFTLTAFISWVCRSWVSFDDAAYSFNTWILQVPFLHLFTILTLFLAISNSVHEVLQDRAIHLRESFLNLPISGWYFGKWSVMALNMTIVTAINCVVAFTILKIPYSFFPGIFTGLLLVSLVGISIGLCISSWPAIPARVAQLMVPIVIVPQLILTGTEPFQYEDISHLSKPNIVENGAIPNVSDLTPARWGLDYLLATYYLTDQHQPEPNVDIESSITTRFESFPKLMEDGVIKPAFATDTIESSRRALLLMILIFSLSGWIFNIYSKRKKAATMPPGDYNNLNLNQHRSTPHNDWRWGIIDIEGRIKLAYHFHPEENNSVAKYDPSLPLIDINELPSSTKHFRHGNS
ncbi:MAG: ATP-binding cassette domain-containing protein [Verrucomicrobiales bacterium]|nr:ATP-binding cassette domain-containing protein [Verrucomicrobiales bacterium]